MQATAKLRYLRIAPRKVRLVADLIRGKRVEQARTILNFTVKKGSLPLLKLLDQAIANAKNNLNLDPANLFISKITVDMGAKSKRWRARARGQAYEIQKIPSHINIVLDEIVESKKKAKKEETPLDKGKEAEDKTETKIIPKQEKPQFREKLAEKPKTEREAKRKFIRRKAF